MPWSWAYGDVAWVAGGVQWSDPCSFCDRWCGYSGGLLGAQYRAFHKQGTLELERQASVVDKLESRVEEMEQLKVQLGQLTDSVQYCWCAGAPPAGGGIQTPGRASTHWKTFLLATETVSAVPQTQFIDRVVVLPVVL